MSIRFKEQFRTILTARLARQLEQKGGWRYFVLGIYHHPRDILGSGFAQRRKTQTDVFEVPDWRSSCLSIGRMCICDSALPHLTCLWHHCRLLALSRSDIHNFTAMVELVCLIEPTFFDS